MARATKFTDVTVSGGLTVSGTLTNAANAAAIAAKIPATEKAAASGVATLDANTLIPAAQLPADLVGLGVLRAARMRWDFAVDGGAQGEIIPASGPTLPNKSVIIGGLVRVITTVEAAGGTTIAIGTSAGSSATSLLAAEAIGSWSAQANLTLVPQLFTQASIVALSAAGKISLTASAALTAGKFDVIVLYVVMP